MTGKYDDIIQRPHHVSTTHPQMLITERAAQFSPFAALVGYEEAIREAGRVTLEKIEIDDSKKDALDMKLHILEDAVQNEPVITITFFNPDKKKTGGRYERFTGAIKKVDEYESVLVFTDGKIIPIEDIFEIESDIFLSYE